MRQLPLSLLLGLAVTACAPSPATTAPGAPSAPTAIAATPTPVAPAPAAPGQAQPYALSGEFPLAALQRMRAGYHLLQTPDVTVDDLGRMAVTVNGAPLAAGTYAFSNVRVRDGKVTFTLKVATAPAAGETIGVSTKTKSFALALRVGPDAPTADGVPLMGPRSTAIALLRIEQARRGVPTDSPLPANVITRMAEEVQKTLSSVGTGVLDDMLAPMVRLATDLAAKDDADALDRLLHPTGGSAGSSLPLLGATATRVALVGAGATGTFTVEGDAGAVLTAASADPAVATVAATPDTPGAYTVTAVAAGTTTLTISAADGRRVTVQAVVTTTAVSIQ